MPLDTMNDIRSMDAEGVPRAEIARRLGVSRNTVAKYADMEDMSPAAPEPAPRSRPALAGHEAWVESVLESDLGAPRKQRHTAKRVYDRLVAERGYGGSCSTVRRFVADWRRSRASGGGEGYLELEWAPGACQVDFGNFRAVVAGEALDLKLLVLTLPHSNERQCAALRSETAECLCAGLGEVFGRWGRAPRVMVLDNATEAGRRLRGTVVESRLFSQFRGHYRFEARFRDPYSGNEKGSVENAVGFLRRNLLVPVPSVGSMAELNAMLADGCARLRASSSRRDGRPTAEALREDLAGMLALPGVPFDAVRWVGAKADKRGYVRVDGREYVRAPPGTAGSCWWACGPPPSRSSPTAAAGSRCCPAPSGRGRPCATPCPCCRRSWPGRGPSASRPSGATCPRRSSRASTGWTARAAGRPSGRSAGPAPPAGSRPPASRRSGSSRAGACPTTRPSTCRPGASPPAPGSAAAPTCRSTTGS